MATVCGGLLLLAFLLGPRYGMDRRLLRFQRQRTQAHVLMLLVHLYNHEHEAAAEEESGPPALQQHLRWSARRSRAVIALAQQRGLVTLSADGRRLHLPAAGARPPSGC